MTFQWFSRLILPALFLGTAWGCSDDEDFSTSVSAHLSFSLDTLSLDTVIAGEGTNTYTFMVYNANASALRIATVALEGGSSSPYRVNVDGTYLASGMASDLTISAEDSLRVFVELTASETDSDDPVEVIDRLSFTLESGVTQSVTLQAWSRDVVPLTGVVFAADTTLTGSRPYRIRDSLVVAEGATLTIGKGVTLLTASATYITVRGTLVAEGSADSLVTFRGDRMGYMFSNQPYDRIPAQWGGIVFTPTSYGNRLVHCDIHAAETGIQLDSSSLATEKLYMEATILHNMSGHCLTARNVAASFLNCQITNAGNNCVNLAGGDYTFTFCTLANFYPFSSSRGIALYFANFDGNTRLPLLRADFNSCLITGYSTDEIIGTANADYPDDSFEYSFSYCLLGTPEYEDEEGRLNACLWDADDNEVCRQDNFSPAFDHDKLIYLFTLDSLAVAIDAADPALPYATDLNGAARGSLPDIGCYER